LPIHRQKGGKLNKRKTNLLLPGIDDCDMYSHTRHVMDVVVVRQQNATTSPSDSKRSNLEKYLLELGIAFRTVEHPAVFTVAAMMEHISHLDGFHAKNLLVKDKKTSKLYLITARHDATVQLGQISKVIGAKELRFADAETLEASLGVQQGSVTPLALLNDAQEHRVTFVLDGQLWSEKNSDGQDSYLNFHPMTNEATTSITVAGFKVFLKATGHEPVIIQL
jgi:Ala-tRNA(Pro) deacylase